VSAFASQVVGLKCAFHEFLSKKVSAYYRCQSIIVNAQFNPRAPGGLPGFSRRFLLDAAMHIPYLFIPASSSRGFHINRIAHPHRSRKALRHPLAAVFIASVLHHVRQPEAVAFTAPVQARAWRPQTGKENLLPNEIRLKAHNTHTPVKASIRIPSRGSTETSRICIICLTIGAWTAY